MAAGATREGRGRTAEAHQRRSRREARGETSVLDDEIVGELRLRGCEARRKVNKGQIERTMRAGKGSLVSTAAAPSFRHVCPPPSFALVLFATPLAYAPATLQGLSDFLPRCCEPLWFGWRLQPLLATLPLIPRPGRARRAGRLKQAARGAPKRRQATRSRQAPAAAAAATVLPCLEPRPPAPRPSRPLGRPRRSRRPSTAGQAAHVRQEAAATVSPCLAR